MKMVLLVLSSPICTNDKFLFSLVKGPFDYVVVQSILFHFPEFLGPSGFVHEDSVMLVCLFSLLSQERPEPCLLEIEKESH